MRGALRIMIIALVVAWAVGGTAAQAGKAKGKCLHHPHWRWDGRRHLCVKVETHGPKAPIEPSHTATPTELIGRIVGDGGPPSLPGARPHELSGEIAVYDTSGQLVAERSTSQGAATVRVSPGAYKVTASIGQSQGACQEKEVTVVENHQTQVTLACTIN
jgi:hypothetical protein